MPLQATSGAASYDAFGGGVAAGPANYIEDVFSTWLYTGNGSTQTITNGIDLAGKGGLVWTKSRNVAGSTHALQDTVRGANNYLQSQTTSANINLPDINFAFNSNGFSQNNTFQGFNNTGDTYASWTFREQPKFFDVVTWTGDGTGDRAISHALTSTPGCILLKRTSGGGSDWSVYHTSLGTSQALRLNTTEAVNTATAVTAVSSSTFTVNSGNSWNFSGQTYVAYLFAHNAGGFGLTGTDNVISCGSFTGSGAGVATTVTLGYEPQFIIAKRTDAAQNWIMFDNMRGFDNTNAARLFPNLSNAESTVPAENLFTPTATGFRYGPGNAMGDTANIIYIAIRRGPMKVPTTGTSVFAPATYTGNGATQTFSNTVNNGGSLVVIKGRNSTFPNVWYDQLRGAGNALASNSTSAALQAGATYEVSAFTNKGFSLGENFNYDVNNTSAPFVYWQFVRAPGFFDEVCYTGNQTARTINHNLGVVPELMIMKNRSSSDTGWITALTVGGLSWTSGNFLRLELTNGTLTNTAVLNTTPTSTVFSIPSGNTLNNLGDNYVAYLFATCPGVSKVFSYTGNGSSQTINCGFTGGARFVMVKRTDSAGNWLVVDTARGLVSAGDPTLYLNSTAAEVTGVDWIDPDSSGFIVNQEGTMNANVSSATYIGLAIA
jgi:hypothetical protein